MPINKLKATLLDPHKKELLKGSAESIVIKLASILIGYVFIMILSRNYGAKAVGIYQIALRFMTVTALISLFGFNNSIIRFTAELVSKNHIKELVRVQKKFSLISSSISTVMAVGVFVFSEELAEQFLKDKNLAIVFQSVSIAMPFFTLNQLYVEIIRGFKKIKVSEFFRLFSVRFFNLIGFLIAIWILKFNNFLPVITLVIAMVISFILVLIFIKKYFKEKLPYNINEKLRVDRKYISTSFTMYQSVLLMVLSNQALVFVLAYYTNPAEVGVYNVAFQIASLTILITQSIASILMPKFSESFYSHKNDFSSLVSFSAKIFFWSSAISSIITIIFSDLLMGLFGDEFASNSFLLIILSCANLFNASTGVGGLIVDMIGLQKIRRNILFINTTLTLLLSFLLIPTYGAYGASLVFMFNVIFGNIIGIAVLKSKINLWVIYLPFKFNKKAT